MTQLRIGELARFARVSPRTVRFYHELGLLPEPIRDVSGYRVYGAEDVIRLVRIVALAQAGVPLARVDELLTSPDTAFSEAVVEIDRQVEEQIAHLELVRQSLRTLDSPDRVALPPRLADFMDRIRADPAVPQRYVDYLRDTWVLAHALYGDALRTWLESPSGQVLFSPESVAMTIGNLALADADPDDPRIEEHVARSVDWILSIWSESDDGAWEGAFNNPHLNSLMNAKSLTTPAWTRISERVTEELLARGHDTGWELPD